MILELDMGNTRLKWRIRDRQITLTQGAVGVEESLDLLADRIDPYRREIDKVVVASVVGRTLEQNLIDWSLAYLALRPLFARSGVACGVVRNGYRETQVLGVDRWLGMIAAYKLTRKACVVVSFGTAITLDLVAQDGEHLGGFIAPGLNLMLDSLTSGTRQIQLSQPLLLLDLSPGATTSDAVYSACAAMLMGLVDNGVRQLSKHGQNLDVQMIFTGGDAGKLLPFYPKARLVPDLVLDGLGCVFEYP